MIELAFSFPTYSPESMPGLFNPITQEQLEQLIALVAMERVLNDRFSHTK
jgi:hypothetical protein